MRRHRFDPLSLVFGLSFATAAIIVLAGGSIVDDGQFLVPTTLLGLGVALLAHTATRHRQLPPASVSAPLASPAPDQVWSPHTQTWSWTQTPSGVQTPTPTPAATAAPAQTSDDLDNDDQSKGSDAGPGNATVVDPSEVADPDEDIDARSNDTTSADPSEARDPDAGLHDRTIEEPLTEPHHDAWVWKRVGPESTEDGKPTWVRRPDTDPNDENDDKTESPD